MLSYLSLSEDLPLTSYSGFFNEDVK
jgi:hypothetical protein